jgi:hypothetical protein
MMNVRKILDTTFGYIFYLHDRAEHARFHSIEKRVDEIRKRLALEH